MSKTKYLASTQSHQSSMAETIGMSLLVYLGLPLFLGGWFSDLETWKSWTACIGGGIMLTIRFVFWCDKAYHNMWLRKMERRRILKEIAQGEAQTA
jgi:NADH:ubiquinone oxidoreductase subunit H